MSKFKVGDIVYDERTPFDDYAVITKINITTFGTDIYGVWAKTKELAIQKYKEYLNIGNTFNNLSTGAEHLTKVGEYKQKITNWRERIK